MARDSVREHLSGAFATAGLGEPVGAIVVRLRRQHPGDVELVCGIDEHGRFAGALAARGMLALDDAARFGEAMHRDYPAIAQDEDPERAASLALHRGVDALPVLDAQQRVVGIMPALTLLHVLRREHVGDLHQLAGIQRETRRARHAIEDPPMRRVGHRLPWLLVGLAGSAAATAAVAWFEPALSRNVAIAFFLPAIVYLADAVGTQSEAIAVRGLSLTRAGIQPLLLGELSVGTAIGAVLGALAFAPVMLAFGDARLAAAVALSIWAASSFAATLGLLLPWTLSRLRLDPAYGSGPVATVIQDVASILAYFAVVGALGV